MFTLENFLGADTRTVTAEVDVCNECHTGPEGSTVYFCPCGGCEGVRRCWDCYCDHAIELNPHMVSESHEPRKPAATWAGRPSWGAGLHLVPPNSERRND